MKLRRRIKAAERYAIASSMPPRQKPSAYIRAALGFTVFCLSLFAQNPSATITGSISDPSGASVANASVTLTGVDTGVSLKAQTNVAGLYRISGLIPGVYRIGVSKEGSSRWRNRELKSMWARRQH